jgi:CHAT domain-containing protein/Tfp pilus assembly protein PilF
MKNITLFFIFFSFFVNAQNNQDDSNILESQIIEFQKSGNIHSVDYANLLNNLAMFYHNEGKYDKAEPLYLKALEIKKKNLGDKHPEFANTLNNLALLYLYQDKYQKAELLLLKALEINKLALGEKHINYANSLNSLAMLYDNQDMFSKAEPLYLKSLEIRKEILGENSEEYASSLNNLASFYFNQGKYSESEKLMLKALDIFKNILGEKNSDYAKLLNNLAVFYNNQGKFLDSETIFLETLKIRKELLGENNIDYATSMEGLAGLYADQGKYDVAEPLFLKSIQIHKEILGENSIDYAESLNDLGVMYSDQGKYNEAELIYLKVLVIKKKILGEKNLNYVTTVGNLATLYSDLGKYSLAEPLHLKVIDIRKEILGKNHPDYALSIDNLAQLYQEQGKYSKAEPLIIEALEIRKETLGERNLDYASSLNNLASSYQDQGKYKDAEPIYLKSLAIKKEFLGENHPDYLSTLSNLATLYDSQGKYTEAEPLHLKILEIRKEILGEKHPDYINSLNNLGAFYFEQKKYSEAEPLFIKALEISKEIYGEKHSSYAISLANLAGLYLKQKKYVAAEPLFFKSLEIRKEILGETHPDFITNLYDIADFYQTVDLNDKSSIYFDKFIKTNQKRMVDDIYGFTEKEQIVYVNSKKKSFIYPLSFLHNFPNIYTNINNSCYENELLIKNLSLRNQERITKSIQKSGNKLLQIKYQQFIDNKIKIKKLQELPLDKLPANFSMLIKENEKIEKELSKESTSFSDYKKAIEISWNNVKNKLKKDEVVIDLISFTYYNKKLTNNIVYAAFVVSKKYINAKYISLFENKKLDFLLTRIENEKEDGKINKQYTDKAISDLFLKPLEKELEGIKTIYLSPTGLGHQIDFAALPLSGNQTLGEKYNLHILSSPAELIDYKISSLDKKSNIELLLYGGIDYNKSNPKTEIDNEIVDSTNDIAALRSQCGISDFDYLNGTNNEINQIQLKGSLNGFTTTVYKESEATEESIKQLDGRTTPYVLHLATHGFFSPDPKQEIANDIFTEKGKSKIYKASDDPMMRSGLLLAGANNYWGKSKGNTTKEDGILTASEISNLDLSACQLVVLSACETGLGEVKGSEGVFGLQRAFKMAGVKNIIMSLWKVPDTQTAELFDIFYSESFAGKTIHEAFQSAQSQMKAKYSPYYWAGFVLLE